MSMTIDQYIQAIGKESFRGLNYNKELQNNGISRMMWTVTFVLNKDIVWTEPCLTPAIAFKVAITAKKEEK